MANRFSSNRKLSFALTLAASASLALALSCDMLLPPTGFPEEGPSPRSTPRGTIEQLFRAYEDKRIDLFTDLLPKNGTYRFFISPEYSTSYTGTDAVMERIGDESEYVYVKAGGYHYWGHESELAKHRRMFNAAGVTIEFTEYPDIDEGNFRYRVNDENDTTHVELKTMYGELCIGRDTLYCTQKEGQMQVFLLEREEDGKTGNKLWVIRDWFDLDYVK